MGSSQSNIANINQEFMNNITQASQQVCSASSVDTASGNVIIVTGANIGGNFTGIASTNASDASCSMTSSMTNSVENILSATIQQTNAADTGLFSGWGAPDQDNDFDVEQTVVNNISQINQATCAANTVTSKSNNYIYVSNTNIQGDFVGVSSESDANASCSINNLMKNQTYNQAQADTSQGNKTQSIFTALLGTFAIIIGIVVIGVIILFAIGAIGSVGFGASKVVS